MPLISRPLLLLLMTMSLNVLVFGSDGDHQIGENFGKELINLKSINTHPFFQVQSNRSKAIAEATAWVTHPTHGASHYRLDKAERPLGAWDPKSQSRYIGSAHLLGEFRGHLIMATNSHLVHEKICNDISIEFVFLKGSPQVICKEVIIRDDSLDYALLRVEPENEAVRSQLKSKGINFDYDYRPQFGEKLYTIGASYHGDNPNDIYRRSPRDFFLTRDEDCRLLSTEVRLLRNPKKATESFKPRFAHSWPTGCDAFKAGDCGAVYVSESTGKIIGTYWTEGSSSPGAIHWQDIANSPALWSRVTYAVPAHKIKEKMLSAPLAQEKDYQDLFKAIFGR